MKTCVILDDYQGVAQTYGDFARLADRVAVTSVREHIDDEDALVARIGAAEIVVIMRERTPFPARLFARLPKLELLVTTGMRNASVDLAAAGRVVVCGTAGSSVPPMELTWALILGLARHVVPESDAFRHNGPWQSTIGTDLHASQIGLVGLGKIGISMAHVAAAFGMRVAAWSPNLTPERAAAAGVQMMTKDALLETSDFVSIHLVLAAATRGLIAEADLRRMRPAAFLVNTSRAGIVDQDALLRALQEHWIAGAGLDVFDVEPLQADHPFRRLPNVLALPHLGYVSDSNYRSYFTGVVEDIEAWLNGGPIRTLG
jgi:phosphoglycerate dehydrogenase-like enzyme